MAKIAMHAARYATHTSDIEGATHFAIGVTLVKSTDSGDAAEPGTVETIVHHRHITVTVYGQDFAALLALCEAAAADFIGGYKASGGANRTITVKLVYFDEVPQEIAAPPKDAGGEVPRFAIRGTAQWTATDTLALMILDEADA